MTAVKTEMMCGDGVSRDIYYAAKNSMYNPPYARRKQADS